MVSNSVMAQRSTPLAVQNDHGGTDAMIMVSALVVPPVEADVRVARPCARDVLLEAEQRGAPSTEVRLLEEAAIAAGIARVRARLRAGAAVSPAEARQYERDQELLRRFPDDRRGPAGEGWFHVPS
jgi:hypothetical protein